MIFASKAEQRRVVEQARAGNKVAILRVLQRDVQEVVDLLSSNSCSKPTACTLLHDALKRSMVRASR